MSLNQDQINALLAPLNPARVRQVQGNAHLEAWDVRRYLTRIFGFGGWEDDLLTLDCISERSNWDTANPLKGRHTVVYRCTMRLTVKDPDGNYVSHWDDGACGDAQNQPSLGDAHDQAMKTAMSQALKRCAVNLADQFGLGLYDGGKTAPVVGKTLAHPEATEVTAREDVTGGEMQDHVPDQPTPPTDSPARADVPAVSTPAVDEPAGSAPSPDAAVELLRGRVIDAMKLPRKEAIIAFGKLNVEIAKARLQQAPTTTPSGSPTTLGGLIDQALNIVSRPEPAERKPHGLHDDEASREDVAS